MTEILLWPLMLPGAAILVWGLQSRDRMIQFPFLAAVVFNRLGHVATARDHVLSQRPPYLFALLRQCSMSFPG